MAASFFTLPSPESDDSAVDEIISEAIDLSVLEQLPAPKSSSGRLPDSSLSTNLQTRFQKLKTFPQPTIQHEFRPSPRTASASSTDQKQKLKPFPQPRLREGSSSTSLASVGASRESPSPLRQMSCFGCFTRRSPKMKERRNRRIQGAELGEREWGKSDEILTDFSTFSLKEQQRRLKKALKEEEKASKDAAKVVEWVKQASARMAVSRI